MSDRVTDCVARHRAVRAIAGVKSCHGDVTLGLRGRTRQCCGRQIRIRRWMISPSAAQRDIVAAALRQYIQKQQYADQYGYALFEHNGATHHTPSPLSL